MPTLGEVLQHARQLLQTGRFAEAEAVYRQLIAHVPQAAELWHELGLALWQSGRPQPAVEAIARATQLEPRVPAYHSNLGALHRALKHLPEAVTSFQRAIDCGPPTPELYNNLALALKDSGQTDPALEAFERALALRPDYPTGLFNRGNVLLDVGRLDEAIASYRQVLALQPNDAGVLCKLGVAHYDLGQYDEAESAFNRALEIQPNYPEVRRNRALVWLIRGEYDRGWREFEWRLECEGFNKRVFPQPAWDGSPLAGRRLLVHPEQGLGDTLQFVRYVPLVEEAGGQALLEVQSPLAPLLKCSGFERWLVPAGTTPQFDVHAPLMTLAGYLPDRSGQPVWRGPYLQADSALVEQWRPRLAAVAGFKVGIVWAGNPDHPHDRFRSMRLAELAPLAAIPGVRLISLQKGAGRRQLNGAGAPPLVDLGDQLDERTGAFMDSAAVMRQLDLVIAVDTSVAHLAGGLGVPVWVPLQLSPDWRWLTQGSKTPWYGSMRLFRQQQFDAWPAVVAEMAAALAELANRV